MVRILAPLCVLALCLLLVSDASSADKNKKKKGQKTMGSVVKVEASAGSTDEGTLTVKTIAGKKKGNPDAAGMEVTVQVKKSTTIEKKGAKKAPSTPATFLDLQAGQRVVITRSAGGSVASSVSILPAGKKKKNVQN